jgi:hypothetical protein
LSFRFFRNHCSNPDLATLPISELSELLDLVEYLRQNLTIERQELFGAFATAVPSVRGAWYAQLPDDRKAEAYKVLDFAILLWIMVDVKRCFLENHGEGTINVWRSHMSLKDLLCQLFPRRTVPRTESSRWPYNFHAANLHHTGDFKIIWTERLQDHLVIDESSGTIAMRIYHHARVLDCLRHSAVGKAFPPAFLEETSQSLAILLPMYNRASQRWIDREHRIAKRNKGAISTWTKI